MHMREWTGGGNGREEFTTTIDRSECAARMFSENSDLNEPHECHIHTGDHRRRTW